MRAWAKKSDTPPLRPQTGDLTHRLWRYECQADNVRRVAGRSEVQRRLGRAVKAVRAQHGLTQEQVSAAAGLHPTYVSDIERGARNPSWEAMTRLASGIGVPIVEIARAYEAESSSDRSTAAGSGTVGKQP